MSKLFENDSVKQSPFAYHENSTIRYDIIKPTKGIQSIRNLFERRLINDKDAAILECISTYGYLNAHLIRNILSQQMECNETFCKEHLAKLVKCDLLVRMRIVYKDIYARTHESPYFYSLSERGRKLFGSKNEGAETHSALDILKTMAFNQFYIKIKNCYKSTMINAAYCMKNSALPYDGRLFFDSRGKKISMNVITIRQQEGWQKEYLDKLRTQKLRSGTGCSAILVLCETELQALEAEKSRKSVKELAEEEVCYMCDHSTFSDKPALEQLIKVRPENNYSAYDICEIMVDDN